MSINEYFHLFKENKHFQMMALPALAGDGGKNLLRSYVFFDDTSSPLSE